MTDREKLDGLLQRVERVLEMHLPREPGIYTRGQEMTIAAWSEVKTYREQIAKDAPDA